MNLPSIGREYYKLAITTAPSTQTTDWSASFDGGTTWFAATDVLEDDLSTHCSGWLLAGPSASQGTAVAVISKNRTQPLVRLTSNPEVIVRDSPVINLV